MITRRDFAAVIAGAALIAPAHAMCTTPPQPSLLEGLRRLQWAYPNFIRSFDDRHTLWTDGTLMPVTLFPFTRPISEKISNPDLAAQSMQAYPKGRCAIPTDPNSEPGRVRYNPFFARMYGAGYTTVSQNLIKVPWPSIARAPFVWATKINGVAGRLTQIAGELAALPKPFHRYFDNPAGGFKWRPIAGTHRLSPHAYGFAVDINTNRSDYWLDELKGATNEPAHWQPKPGVRNRIPFEIVEIFERQGFIWGGKWYHYDTMHFE